MVVQYQIAVKLNFCYIRVVSITLNMYEGLQFSARYKQMRSLAKKQK